MSSLNRAMRLAAAAALVTLIGAPLTPASAVIMLNALSQNALTGNSLTQNALTANSLAANALIGNSLSLNGLAPTGSQLDELDGVTVEAVTVPSEPRR
jgi:hypothetical protein